jgi:hypothetical protein
MPDHSSPRAAPPSAGGALLHLAAPMTSHRRRLAAPVVLLALALAACKGSDADAKVARGRRLAVVHLRDDAEAAIYRAAVGASFDVGPSLTLLVHPRRLPRTAGLAGGDSLSPGLLSALRERGVVQGSCETPGGRDTPRCTAPAAGYVIRGSDVFRGAGDTVQFYFAAERYATPASGPQDALRFEKIYQLVPRGNEWRVAREARAPW